MSNNFKYYAPFFKNYTGKGLSFLQVNDGNQPCFEFFIP